MLRAATVEIRDLSDSRTLGLSGGSTITLDNNGAGRGWFIDSTPTLDEEFTSTAAAFESRATEEAAIDRVDLLTVIMHELVTCWESTTSLSNTTAPFSF